MKFTNCWWLNIFDLHRQCHFGVFFWQTDVALPKNLAPDSVWHLKTSGVERLLQVLESPSTRVQHCGLNAGYPRQLQLKGVTRVPFPASSCWQYPCFNSQSWLQVMLSEAKPPKQQFRGGLFLTIKKTGLKTGAPLGWCFFRVSEQKQDHSTWTSKSPMVLWSCRRPLKQLSVYTKWDGDHWRFFSILSITFVYTPGSS